MTAEIPEMSIMTETGIQTETDYQFWRDLVEEMEDYLQSQARRTGTVTWIVERFASTEPVMRMFYPDGSIRNRAY